MVEVLPGQGDPENLQSEQERGDALLKELIDLFPDEPLEKLPSRGAREGAISWAEESTVKAAAERQQAIKHAAWLADITAKEQERNTQKEEARKKKGEALREEEARY